jgi:hypothetical protein
MRKMVVLAVMVLFAATAQAARPTMFPTSHLRCLSRTAADLAAEAASRSRLVRSLLAQIERSDVIVFLAVSGYRPDDGLRGATRFISAAPGARYLLIDIDGSRPQATERIALLGHELCHVLEVARASDVTDTASLMRLYRRIGTEWLQGHFETASARAAEAVVWDEAGDAGGAGRRTPAILVHLLQPAGSAVTLDESGA